MTLKSVIFCVSFIFYCLSNFTVQAADSFAKIKLTPAAQIFLVLKDVNVRAGPKTKSARVGRLRKKTQVAASGKAKGTEWVLIKKDGKNFGFVYGTALVPMIDGRLSKPLSGNLEAQKIAGRKLAPCHYTIQFEGKVKVEGDTQITSDYRLAMECDYKKKTIKLNATMFLTELPYLDNRKPTYQINVDLFNIPMEDEDIFSSTVIYHTLKKQITFEGVNKEDFKAKSKIAKMKAPDLAAALRGAVAMAHQSWGIKIWAELAKSEE